LVPAAADTKRERESSGIDIACEILIDEIKDIRLFHFPQLQGMRLSTNIQIHVLLSLIFVPSFTHSFLLGLFSASEHERPQTLPLNSTAQSSVQDELALREETQVEPPSPLKWKIPPPIPVIL
jgi:hypothetical protein